MLSSLSSIEAVAIDYNCNLGKSTLISFGCDRLLDGYRLNQFQFPDSSPVKIMEVVLILAHDAADLPEVIFQDMTCLGPGSLQSFGMNICFLDFLLK